MKLLALLLLAILLFGCSNQETIKLKCDITEYSMQEDYLDGLDFVQVTCRDGNYLYDESIILDCNKNNATGHLSYDCDMRG